MKHAKRLTKENIKKMSNILRGKNETRNRALLYWGLGSGMRISEILSLRCSDVFDGKKIKKSVLLEAKNTKNKKTRTVFISPQARQHMLPLVQKRIKKSGFGGYVFCSQKNPAKSLLVSSAVAWFTNLAKSVGLSDVSSHSMRATHADQLRKNGFDLRMIQEQLGHSSLAITQMYFRVTEEERLKMVNSLDY